MTSSALAHLGRDNKHEGSFFLETEKTKKRFTNVTAKTNKICKKKGAVEHESESSFIRR